MQKMGWFGVVRGHSRSTAMSPFDRAHRTSYSTLIETMRLSCTVFEIQPAICRKSPILTQPHLYLAPPHGVFPVEFCGDLWCKKTRVPGLSCGVVPVILRFAVLVELRLVTDGRTRTQAYGQYRGCIASRGNKKNALEPLVFYIFETVFLSMQFVVCSRCNVRFCRPTPCTLKPRPKSFVLYQATINFRFAH